MIKGQDKIPCTVTTVTVEQVPAAIIYINSTQRKLENLLGEDYTIHHNGDLSWTIKPKIKYVGLIGGFSL